jgi:hypothetical protein
MPGDRHPGSMVVAVQRLGLTPIGVGPRRPELRRFCSFARIRPLTLWSGSTSERRSDHRAPQLQACQRQTRIAPGQFLFHADQQLGEPRIVDRIDSDPETALEAETQICSGGRASIAKRGDNCGQAFPYRLTDIVAVEVAGDRTEATPALAATVLMVGLRSMPCCRLVV